MWVHSQHPPNNIDQGRIFIFFKGGPVGTIYSGVQAAPLSELWQGLGIRVKDFHTK
jgi:hypothetical protein